MTVDNSPFFIVGVHRSGTTLLRYMLSSSPRVYIPPESDFVPYFFGRDPLERLSPERVARILHQIFERYRFAKEWKGEPPEAEAFWEQMSSPTPRGLLDALYGAYARQYGAVRWADKTPIYASYVDLIHRIFPRARFVHLIRDGRDVALSMRDKWGRQKFHVDLYFGARKWVQRIRQARAAGARLGPDLYYELRYESLVREPEETLRAVCAFLNEPYLPLMAQSQILGRERIASQDFHAAVRQPPNPKRVERWRQEMSPAEQRLFDRVAGALLKELDYARIEVGDTSARERLWFVGLALKYHVMQSGRRLLQALGVFPPN